MTASLQHWQRTEPDNRTDSINRHYARRQLSDTRHSHGHFRWHKANTASSRLSEWCSSVSDASESAWMQYVYMQYPMPTNVTGVPVTIYAIDPNGNQVLLGDTTTDSSGVYSIEINTNNLLAGPGLYKVTSIFAGSNSYWGSSAESTFTVQSAAATPAPTAAPVQSVSDLYFVPAIAGLFVFVAVIGAVLAILMLRKRA